MYAKTLDKGHSPQKYNNMSELLFVGWWLPRRCSQINALLRALYPNRARKLSITYLVGWKAVKSWYIQRIKYHRNYGPCDYWQDCLTATFLYRSILFLSISHIVAPSTQLQPTSHSMHPHYNLGLKFDRHGERILWIFCQGQVRHLPHYTFKRTSFQSDYARDPGGHNLVLGQNQPRIEATPDQTLSNLKRSYERNQ